MKPEKHLEKLTATHIADRLLFKTRDVREAVRLVRLCKSREEVDEILGVITPQKASPKEATPLTFSGEEKMLNGYIADLFAYVALLINKRGC